VTSNRLARPKVLIALPLEHSRGCARTVVIVEGIGIRCWQGSRSISSYMIVGLSLGGVEMCSPY
jgi:hypothetical protein